MSAKTTYICDRVCCPETATAPALDDQLPAGWISGGGRLKGPHLCPQCAAAYRASLPPAPEFTAPDWRPGQPVDRRMPVAEWLGRAPC